MRASALHVAPLSRGGGGGSSDALTSDRIRESLAGRLPVRTSRLSVLTIAPTLKHNAKENHNPHAERVYAQAGQPVQQKNDPRGHINARQRESYLAHHYQF